MSSEVETSLDISDFRNSKRFLDGACPERSRRARNEKKEASSDDFMTRRILSPRQRASSKCRTAQTSRRSAPTDSSLRQSSPNQNARRNAAARRDQARIRFRESFR